MNGQITFFNPCGVDLAALTAERPLLVTDSDPAWLSLYRDIFDHVGIRCIITRDVPEALALCATRSVSLVISDIRKGPVSGFDLLRALRADPHLRHLPLLFISGSPQMQEQAQRLGADGFLAKPVHPRDVIQEVCRILELYYPS
jgi:CheY-like chemotaxis protein